MQETWVQPLGQEDPLEKETATHSSTLAWRLPWTEEPGGPQSVGSKDSDVTGDSHTPRSTDNPAARCGTLPGLPTSSLQPLGIGLTAPFYRWRNLRLGEWKALDYSGA